jgi:hypothetical protein
VERESWQKHKVLPLQAEIGRSAESSQGAMAPLATSRNVINDHCEFEIGLKRAIRTWESLFHQKVTPPCTTHPLLHRVLTKLNIFY